MTEAEYQELLAQVKQLQRQEEQHRQHYARLVPEGMSPMAKRPLPPSKVIASTAKEPRLRRKGPTNQAAPQGCADELNAQRQRPAYDEERP